MSRSRLKDPALRPIRQYFVFKCALVVFVGLSVMAAGGCEIFGFIAAGIKENTPRNVEAEYEGLTGHSFTVVVRADRSILADFPGLAAEISMRVNNDLQLNLPETNADGGTTGYIPPAQQIEWLANRPRWRAMMPSELGAELQVERLVMIELFSFRLHDPGNRFIWNGEASGTVRVFEIDSALPDDAVFETEVRVTYPTSAGMTAADHTAPEIRAVLREWFSRRASWLMYNHKEARDIDY